MNEEAVVLILILFFCAGIYWLYRHGMISSKCMKASVFLFRPGKNRCRATLRACSGWILHAGRFRENRIYEIILDAELSKGDVEVTLLDQKKQPLERLNRQFPRKEIELNGKCRYYLCWEFKGATGTCVLRW